MTKLLSITVLFLGFWLMFVIQGKSMETDQSLIYFFEFIMIVSIFWFNKLKKNNLKQLYILIPIIILYIFVNINTPISIIVVNGKILIYLAIIPLIDNKLSYDLLWAKKKYLPLVILLYIFNLNNELRPYIWYENNFELYFILSIFFAGVILRYPKWKLTLLFLTIIVGLSFSLSGVLVYLTGVWFAFKNKIFRLIIIIAGISIFILILNFRGVLDLSTIDRVVFWNIGFETWLNDLSLLDKIISVKITPLDYQYNSILDFYNLGVNDIEYPSTLHSYLIRLFLVFGVLGTILILSFLYKSLNFSNIQIKRFVFFSALMSSTSISTFGNGFFLATIFLMIYYGNYKTQIKT